MDTWLMLSWNTGLEGITFLSALISSRRSQNGRSAGRSLYSAVRSAVWSDVFRVMSLLLRESSTDTWDPVLSFMEPPEADCT